MTEKPTPEIVRGIVVADYDHAIAKLNATRRAEQISLDDLAEDAGIIREQLAEWLRGETYPDACTFFDLAAALGYDLALIPRKETDA
jgi:transcriptional regulator with XRE-family HTH domain